MVTLRMNKFYFYLLLTQLRMKTKKLRANRVPITELAKIVHMQ